MATQILDDPTTGDRRYVLTLGFGTTVAMWAVAYVARIPPAIVANWLLLFLFLVCLAGVGYRAGRLTGGGWVAGLQVGLLASALNVLILGSVLGGGDSGVPSAIWWLPGSMLGGALFGALGGFFGQRASMKGGAATRQRTREFQSGAGIAQGDPTGTVVPAPADWTAGFGRVAAGATFLLLIVGGLVTSHGAGLAVVDWPNSFGYNMFLYPLSRMTGGVYYEHAHRLFGSLVGLTTLVLTLHLWKVERRAWVRAFATAAFVLVVVQGILGGLRVTGHFTTSTSAEVTRPDTRLAIVHGVTGQIFFGMMVALAAFLSRTWKAGRPAHRLEGAGIDRGLAILFVAALFIQLCLGAFQRHMAQGLLIHIAMATVVSVVGLTAAIRASVHEKKGLAGTSILKRIGSTILWLLGIQVTLGIAALATTGFSPALEPSSSLEVLLTTAHQATGALLLGASALLVVWAHRLLQPASSK